MELNYKEFGQGDPIVILHGLFGMLDNWQTVAKKLADEYTVIILDQRNHGKSPHTTHMNYALMAEDLHEFLSEKWVHEAHIIGHSMGGKTAMQFAIDYPDMVQSLTVVDIAPKPYSGGHQQIFEALLGLRLADIKNRQEADEQLRAKIEEPGVRQFLLKNLSRKKEGGYQLKMNLPVIYEHYEEVLAEPGRSHDGTGAYFDGKTLFIKGGKSNYIVDEDYEMIKQYFPNSNIEVVPEVGHWVHAEAPDQLIAIVRRFLGN